MNNQLARGWTTSWPSNRKKVDNQLTPQHKPIFAYARAHARRHACHGSCNNKGPKKILRRALRSHTCIEGSQKESYKAVLTRQEKGEGFLEEGFHTQKTLPSEYASNFAQMSAMKKPQTAIKNHEEQKNTKNHGKATQNQRVETSQVLKSLLKYHWGGGGVRRCLEGSSRPFQRE